MNFGDEPVVPSIKLQKKGTTETVILAISEVETWDVCVIITMSSQLLISVGQ